MKNSFNQKKIKLLLLALLATIVGASPAWAQKALPYSYGFENNDLDTEGWTLQKVHSETGIYYNYNGARSGSNAFRFRYSENPAYLVSPKLTGTDKGVDVVFYYKRYSNSYSEKFQVGYTTEESFSDPSSFTYGDEITCTNTNDWKEYSNAFPANTTYIAIKYIYTNAYYLYIDDISFTAPIDGPALTVADGETNISSGYNYSFGLTTPGATKTFTLSNPGTEAAPITIGHTGSFGVSPANTSIPAGGNVTLTVTMPEASGSDVITISSTSDAISDFVINVSGTVKDPNKLWCNFADGVPTGWTNSGSWSIATSGAGDGTSGAGYAYNTSYGTNKLMYSPLVTIADGEKLYLMAKGHGSTANWNVLIIQYSADGNTWTTAKDLTGITNTWQSIEVTEIPAGNWYIGFYGSYVYFTDIYGGTESTAPVIALSQSSYDFGLISASTTTPEAITITNTGKSALTGLNITSDNANFTVSVTDNAATIAANGGTATFNVTMAPNATGAQSANITIKSDNADDLTFTVKGAVAKTGTTTAIFNDETLAGWTKAGKTSYNSDENAAYFYYTTNTLTSPKLTFAADDFLAVKAKMASDYGYVTVKGSTDGTTFTEIKKLDSNVLNQTDYTTAIVSGISTDYKFIQLDGYYCYVKEVAGLTYVAELSVTTGDPAAAVATPAAYDFGECKKNESVTYNFVNASSVGTINITDVTITGDGAAAYSTNWTTSVAAPFALTITRTYDVTRTGAQDAVVTVTTSEGEFVINVTGTDWAPITTFPWTENFNGITSGIPTGWDNTEGTTTNNSYKWNYFVTGHDGACVRFNSYNNTKDYTNFLKTPIMNLPAGKDMQLKFWYKNPTGGDFSVFISNDGGVTYTTALDGATGLTEASSWTEKSISIPSGYTDNVVIVFKGTSSYGNGDAYIYLDDVTVQEQEDGANFAINTDGSAQDFGSVKFNATAEKTYTITNSGNADLVVNVTNTDDFIVQKTVRFSNSKSWGEVWLHAWNDSGDLDGGWPGIKQTTIVGQNEYNQDIYAINIPAGATKIIVHNNSGTQSNDIDMDYTKRGLFIDDSNIGVFFDDGYFMVPAGESTNIKVVMDTKTSGNKEGNVVLTFDALNATNFTIPCTGNVKDPSVLEVDFEDGSFPAGWQVGANWSVGSTNGNHYAVQNAQKTASALVTTPLTVGEGETLTFDVTRNTSGSGYVASLKIRYSQDGGANWSDYVSYYSTNDSDYGSNFVSRTVTGLPTTGNFILEFFGSNIRLDNIQGINIASAPVLTLTENNVTINSGDTKAFGNLTESTGDGLATYTLTNNGNANMVTTVATTGVATAVFSGEGEGITLAKENAETYNQVTLEPGKSVTLTLTVPYATPYGEKNGAMTLTTEGLGDFSVNYTATAVDPTDFVEDFSGNACPDGWYSNNWQYKDGYAYVNTSKDMPLITEKVAAEASTNRNVLSFKAKIHYNYGYGNQTLTVSTSPDRVTWTKQKEFTLTSTTDYQDCSLDALEDGNYYVKFEATNARIDDISGLKRITPAPTRDLMYVGHSGLKTEYTPDEAINATVSIASLRSNEENVYVKAYYRKNGETAYTSWITSGPKTINKGNTTSIQLIGRTPVDEGKYDVMIIVSYSNSTDLSEIALQASLDEAFTVAHTTSMSVTDFAVVTPTATADDDNMFTADFTVTLKNTGTKTLNASDVSLSITNGNLGDYTTYTTKTANQYVFLYPGAYTTDNAIIAVWNWSTVTDAEWVNTVDMGNGLYIAELKEGKTNFCIVRINPNGTGADYWANTWNKSIDLSAESNNVFTFESWDNSSNLEKKDNFTSSAFTLASDGTVTLPVSVTALAGDPGTNAKSFNFYVRENVSNPNTWWYDNEWYKSVTVTAMPATVPLTIADINYATFANAYSVDLDNLPEGLKAYSVKAEGIEETKVTLTEATGKVKGGEGLVFKGDNATYNIPTARSSEASAIDGNLMKGCLAETQLEQNDNLYVLSVNSDGKAEFQRLHTMGATVGAGKAYLDVPGINAGARLLIVVDESTTGIKDILREKGLDGDIYTLDGKRVENPKKGQLYIIGGRKVIVTDKR